MLTIGITGTLGAGKGTVAKYLEKKGFRSYSVRSYLSEVIKKKGKEVNRDTLFETANKLRKKFGSDYIIKKLYQKAKKGKEEKIVIESIRNPKEVNFLRKNSNFFLISVDADPKIRFSRIKKRGSETDKVSYQEFLNNEKREMSSKNPSSQSIGSCTKMADFKLLNNSTKQSLCFQIENILKKILKE